MGPNSCYLQHRLMMGVVLCYGDLIRYGCLANYDQPLTLNIFLSTYTYRNVFRQALTKILVSHFLNITFN